MICALVVMGIVALVCINCIAQAKAYIGDKVIITVSASENNNICAADIVISFEEGQFTLLQNSGNLGNSAVYQTGKKIILSDFNAQSTAKNITYSFTLLTNKNVENLPAMEICFYDYDGNEIDNSNTNTAVITRGDTNNDGVTDKTDLNNILKNLAGGNNDVGNDADLNCDGTVDGRDAILYAKRLKK